MKIKAIITDDGKMYKQVPSKHFKQCYKCPFHNIECGKLKCPESCHKWEEVPEITDDTIQNYVNINYNDGCDGTDRSAAVYRRIFIEAVNWHKQQLEERLKE